MTCSSAIYCRISLDAEGRGLGVRRQEFECRELAERLGFEVGEVFVDNDISAFKGKFRPAWADLTERIGAGEFNTLIAWHPDRLTRHPIQLEALVDLLEATKTKVFTVTAGEYDLGTATGRMCARVVGAVARHESERMGERARARARQDAMTGKTWGKGRRPFGFEDNGVDHRPSEVRVIRRAAKQLLAGMSLAEVARKTGPLTPGKKVHPESLRRMITAPRLVGLRCYKGEVVAVAEWKPILDRATWDQLRAMLESRTVRRPNPKRIYLLTGIAIDHKGRAMYGRTAYGAKRRYATPRTEAGRGVSIPAPDLDALVFKALRAQERALRPVDEWDDLSLERRRRLIRSTFESIVVLPILNDQGRKRCLEERVAITPRG